MTIAQAGASSLTFGKSEGWRSRFPAKLRMAPPPSSEPGRVLRCADRAFVTAVAIAKPFSGGNVFELNAAQDPRRGRLAQGESVRADIAADWPGIPPAIAQRRLATPSAWPFWTRTFLDALSPRAMRTRPPSLRPALCAVASFMPSALPQTCFVNGFGHSCSHGFPA